MQLFVEDRSSLIQRYPIWFALLFALLSSIPGWWPVFTKCTLPEWLASRSSVGVTETNVMAIGLQLIPVAIGILGFLYVVRSLNNRGRSPQAHSSSVELSRFIPKTPDPHPEWRWLEQFAQHQLVGGTGLMIVYDCQPAVVSLDARQPTVELQFTVYNGTVWEMSLEKIVGDIQLDQEFLHGPPTLLPVGVSTRELTPNSGDAVRLRQWLDPSTKSYIQNRWSDGESVAFSLANMEFHFRMNSRGLNGQPIGGITKPYVQHAVFRVLGSGPRLEIRSARYGLEPRWVDVSETLRKHIMRGRLKLQIETENFGVKDPYPGELKQIQVSYSTDGETVLPHTVPEHGDLELPVKP